MAPSDNYLEIKTGAQLGQEVKKDISCFCENTIYRLFNFIVFWFIIVI
jgi:hypothetical protein